MTQTETVIHPTPIERATVYRMAPLGWVRSEESAFRVTLRKSAQYSKAVCISGVPRGKRKLQTHAFSNNPAGIIILEGWGHPEVPSPPVNTGIVLFDDAANDRGFSATLDAYLASSGAHVIADLRTHSPY